MRAACLSAILAAALSTAVAAADPSPAAIEALREGDMRKLVVHDEPKPAPDAVLTDLDGGETRLTDYRGQVVVLNFWATWCAPCREEMPALDALQADLGGPDMQVVPVATGRNPPAGMRRFFEEEGIAHLPLLQDPDQRLAREMAVLGLPITVLLDREGREVARLRGDADWASDSAKAIVRALMAPAEG